MHYNLTPKLCRGGAQLRPHRLALTPINARPWAEGRMAAGAVAAPSGGQEGRDAAPGHLGAPRRDAAGRN